MRPAGDSNSPAGLMMPLTEGKTMAPTTKPPEMTEFEKKVLEHLQDIALRIQTFEMILTDWEIARKEAQPRG
jgi:hypothetical protein